MRSAHAQQEMNNWFFGYNAGLNFSSGAPVATPGSLRGWEGCSAMSDRYGNLLFYTDGITVWNRSHLVMANGTNLNGDTLCTQSALITGYPGNDSLFYIFTVAKEAEAKGLQYSLVDMRLNGGLGDVVAAQKNIPLLTPVCEKVTAVKHLNTNDIWVITHKFGSDEFYVYAVNCAGLNTTPQISAAGNIANRITNTIGYLKASPDGNKLAMAGFTSVVEVFDFNAATGVVTNPRIIAGNPNNITGPYGVEFSPNSKLLYASESYNNNGSGAYYIFQYKVDTPNIADSRIAIDSGYGNTAGAMQLGPDSNIYIAYDQQPFLGAITHPDSVGRACRHIKQYVNLPAGTISGVGLPAFVAGYNRTLLGKDTIVCEGEQVVARVNLPGTTYLWQDGSTLDSLVMNAPGLYWVEIRHNNCIYRDSVRVIWRTRPVVNLGKDTALCANAFPLLLQSPFPGANYLWQDGSANSSYTINGQGLYWMEASLNGCVARDSISVTTRPVTTFNLGNDTSVCEKEQVIVSVAASFNDYSWSNGTKVNSIIIKDSGLYWCEAVNQAGCAWRDSIHVDIRPLPVFSLGNDSVLCEGAVWLLDVTQAGDQFRWQDGSSQSRYQVNKEGAYYVEVSKARCSASDTVTVTYKLKPRPDLGPDKVMCPGQVLVLEPGLHGIPYTWQNGSDQTSFTVTEPGIYSVSVTNECGTVRDEVVVTKGSCKIAIPNAFTPGKGQNNTFRVLNATGLKIFSLRVFNRWGQLLYQTSDPTRGWDGNLAGVLQPAGSYIYMVSYLDDTSGKSILHKGIITLIR
ncbi:T9SS type B sorting domain-containing protein [Paraflavitalea soli]|nr:gliding motility-associated C-terminal domain-containing protein [Paraflavitalea soli]